MSNYAAAADRLPWLPDEPKPAPVKRRPSRLPWAATTVAVVAVAAFWMGARSVNQVAPPSVEAPQASTTVHLPPPASVPSGASQPEVEATPAADVRPPRRPRAAPAYHTRSAPARPIAAEPVADSPSEIASNPIASPQPAALPLRELVDPRPWNPRLVTGARGRLLQIGAFGTVHQAKLGWRFMVRDYPALAHLPSVVRETTNSHGRPFYRFDVGTTSQAHSEVLCQRMKRINLSCAVVGLPWKAKVER